MMNPTAAWLSVTGSVFGIAHTAVKPPATAARAPLAIVSTSSRPGSRRWQCTSTKPGDTTRSAQSIVSTSSRFFVSSRSRGPIASTMPSTINTSVTTSVRCDGSTTRPPASSKLLLAIYRSSLGRFAPAVGVSIIRASFRRFGELWISAGEHIEHRHANGHAVRDLIEDHAEGSVGHVGVDLDSTIHRAGVKNEHVFRGTLETFA